MSHIHLPFKWKVEKRPLIENVSGGIGVIIFKNE